jgi:hypothetical protein
LLLLSGLSLEESIMKPRLLVSALLASLVLSPALAFAAIEDSGADAAQGLTLKNAELSQELRSRGARLGASSSNTDTTWIGYTPSAVSSTNWWGVYAGFGKDGYYRPVNGIPHRGVWDWEEPVHGDSLQGWWPLINLYASTGGQTRTDRNRPWWALDFGNMANYDINEANGRTFGVVGVWHRDAGSLAPAPAGNPSPEWAPAQGNFAAWMGLRPHGDNTYSDAVTGNPFNEDVLEYTSFGAVSAGGNDQGFPGYGSQMDQMLYRDIDLTGNTNQSLTVRFKFRTVMSTGAGTTAATRTGWFDSDPLGVTSGPVNPQRNNFISSSDAGDALAPRDSFMVYVGQAANETGWTPAAGNYGQNFPAQAVYDKQRRWFGEVLRWDRDPASPSSAPQPLHYKELLSVAGVWPAHADTSDPGYVDTTFTLSSAALQSLLDNGVTRLVFRVKTNRGFDDQGTSYSSNQRGAVVIDRVSYQIGAGSEVVFGDFENANDVDNATNVSAIAAWKSTGKPPGIFHHTHVFTDLIYEDLCGQKGDISRQCNMSGVVISAGDHDFGEAAGGLVDGTAQRERNDGVMSPTVQFCGPFNGPGGTNRHGLKAAGSGAGDVDALEDYYVWYDIYAAVMDPFSKGNLWRYGSMSYPGNSKDPDGAGPQLPYPAWGQMRFPGFIIFNPDPQCLIDFEPLKQQAMIKTSNAGGIPDSVRIFLGKTQQCFRFGVSAGCSPTDGCYWDNVSLSIIDGASAGITADIWQWINDAFPANESPGLPGTAAFDTAAAHVKTGLNVAQVTINNLRFDVPGDSVVVTSSSETQRVDMVFRILPGPGNYEPVGRPDLGTLVRRPDSRAIVTKGDGSFWDQYRQTPGDFASPNAVALHHNALGGWDPNVWNSARCDTAELNLFPRQGPGLVLGGPLDPYLLMATYHEDDPHYATLGIVHNRCFVATATGPNTDIVCDGTVPSYISSRPEHADVTGTTREGTKIIPDGLLTPGAHVEYFFRSQASTTPGLMLSMVPDTNVVMQIATEGSTDGHRWQEFGVLPNAWKKTTYYHPVAREFGAGPSCLLVIDNNDRRGNERVWMSIADTIGAVAQRFRGAHSGWNAVGNGDIDNPADNRQGITQLPGFPTLHLGQAGSGGTFDMYQVKASESLTTSAGTIGSRLANRSGGAGQQIVIDKSARIGPTPAMLNAYYTMIMLLSGDLNTGVLGPFRDRSSNDAGLLIGWLGAGNSSTQSRGFWAIGDGFAESNIFGAKAITTDLMLNYLGTDLVHWNYIQFSGNTDDLATYRLLPSWQNKGSSQVLLLGMRNLCLWTNDVLTPGGVGLPTLSQVTSEYDRRYSPGGQYVAPAGVFKDWDPTSPYKTLVDGWDIEHLTHPDDVRTVDRAGYFYKIFTNVWAKLCSVPRTTTCGYPGPSEAYSILCTDVPSAPALVDFARFGNNPMRSGTANVYLGLARPDRVQAKVYDISGRLIRTLADRRFAAGEHVLVWDGTDDAGHAVPRGVYFTQVKYLDDGFNIHRKLTVLK